MFHATARRPAPESTETMEPSSAPWRVLEGTEPETAAREASPSAVPWLAIGGSVLAAVAAIVALVFAMRPDPGMLVDAPVAAIASEHPAGAAPASPVGKAEVVVVDVGGAVAHPGVYRLPAGARLGDAVAAAGGYSARVDAERADVELNLAAVVHDGDQVHVPARGDSSTSAAATAAEGGSQATSPLDLNRATASQLDTLPGVGPVTAAKIIAAREQRPFASLDDFAARKVVGSSTLDKIRTLVTVGP
jgi:competence protein ComEA